MKALLRFIKGTIHYRILYGGRGDLTNQAIVVSINSYRFDALPGYRRWGMSRRMSPAKIVTLP